MVGEEVRDENNQSTHFDIQSELQSLVETRKIPQQIADKLLIKLKEKNVTLSKGQLYTLIDKINQIIINYKKNKETANMNTNGVLGEESDTISQQQNGSMPEMQELFEKIDDLQQQIEQLKLNAIHTTDDIDNKENEQIDSTEKIVTTDDIVIPDAHEKISSGISIDPLSTIPHDPESIIVLMNWLQYLIDQCGYQNLDTILEYYVDINWITDDVKMGLLDYSNGIKKETKDTSSKNGSKDEQTILPSKDHIQSYMFIQKLKGKKFDKHFVDKIQNDLSRLRKKVDKYQHT